MSQNQPDECLACGALVDSMPKHRRWHAALDNLLPGIAAEAERLREASQSQAYPAKRIR